MKRGFVGAFRPVVDPGSPEANTEAAAQTIQLEKLLSRKIDAMRASGKARAISLIPASPTTSPLSISCGVSSPARRERLRLQCRNPRRPNRRARTKVRRRRTPPRGPKRPHRQRRRRRNRATPKPRCWHHANYRRFMSGQTLRPIPQGCRVSRQKPSPRPLKHRLRNPHQLATKPRTRRTKAVAPPIPRRTLDTS